MRVVVQDTVIQAAYGRWSLRDTITPATRMETLTEAVTKARVGGEMETAKTLMCVPAKISMICSKYNVYLKVNKSILVSEGKSYPSQ